MAVHAHLSHQRFRFYQQYQSLAAQRSPRFACASWGLWSAPLSPSLCIILSCGHHKNGLRGIWNSTPWSLEPTAPNGNCTINIYIYQYISIYINIYNYIYIFIYIYISIVNWWTTWPILDIPRGTRGTRWHWVTRGMAGHHQEGHPRFWATRLHHL